MVIFIVIVCCALAVVAFSYIVWFEFEKHLNEHYRRGFGDGKYQAWCEYSMERYFELFEQKMPVKQKERGSKCKRK